MFLKGILEEFVFKIPGNGDCGFYLSLGLLSKQVR